MAFYFMFYLVAANLMIPVAKYADEATCQAVIDAINKDALGTNSELKVGCVDEKTVLDKQKQNQEEEGSKGEHPLPKGEGPEQDL